MPEPPIRVKNGSMTLTLVSSDWKESGAAWTPRAGRNAGGFIVVVEIKRGSRRVLGQPVFGKEVEISYSDGTKIRLKYSGASRKTKVTPKNVLQKVAADVLEYGPPGQGYIARVEVKDRGTNWACEFGGRAELSEIDIYPLP